MAAADENVAMEVFETVQVEMPVGPVVLEGGNQGLLIIVVVGKGSAHGRYGYAKGASSHRGL